MLLQREHRITKGQSNELLSLPFINDDIRTDEAKVPRDIAYGTLHV